MIYELYGLLHKTAKHVLKKSGCVTRYRMVDADVDCFTQDGKLRKDLIAGASYFNNFKPVPEELSREQVYPLENIVALNECTGLKDTYSRGKTKYNLGIKASQAEDSWLSFVNASVIPAGYLNGGLCCAGYISEENKWCLPSWIWTNAALTRMYCRQGEIEQAEKIAQILLNKQLDCGGWIVRNDYSGEGAVPTIAPNDSAYIANNAMLEMYFATGEEQYLQSAEKCALWIMETARPDGMVYIGYDAKNKHWIKDKNIVDVGFTAGLLARLFQITQKQKYKDFLEKFSRKYISCFYNEQKKGFATSLDAQGHQIGGMFGRGQAWALEGLIPAYEVLKCNELRKVIQNTVNTLLAEQKKGGWAYNLDKPLMGQDCKAVPIIGCCLMKWYAINPEQKELAQAARCALQWCLNHTAAEGEAKGGIFSYTVEGAIVHHMYTNTAFVYSSAYAIELKCALKKQGEEI